MESSQQYKMEEAQRFDLSVKKLTAPLLLRTLPIHISQAGKRAEERPELGSATMIQMFRYKIKVCDLV